MQTDITTASLKQIADELRDGMALAKCRKCGCMKETLDSIIEALNTAHGSSTNGLEQQISQWRSEMEPIRYACLGCDYCFPAVAMNAFNLAYPGVTPKETLTCAFETRELSWPPVPGEYCVLCEGGECPVAISTLGSIELSDKIATMNPEDVCMVGKTETENIGIDKIIKNTITNRTIRFLILAGIDPKGHYPGQTLLCLSANGVDESMRVIGSSAKRPILRNVTKFEVEAFRKQVQVVDLIGCEDVRTIVEKVQELSMTQKSSCGCSNCNDEVSPTQLHAMPVIRAQEPDKVQLDRAGYFVVLPQPHRDMITVEHYSYDDTLLRTIEGKDARSLYWTIIQNNWITQLSHSAYLGKELAKAELSMKQGFKYIQDGA
ncbi:MAG: DUF4346 domain-containing protein [Bacteroidota bacterium]